MFSLGCDDPNLVSLISEPWSSFVVFFHVICLAINGLSGILDTICEESARVSRLLEAESSLPTTTELQGVGVYRQWGSAAPFFWGLSASCSVG